MRLQIPGLHRRARRLPLLIPLALLFLACGGDDAPTEPEPAPPDAEAAARAQAQALFTSLEPVVAKALELMLTGGGTIDGEQGTLTVAGSTMTLESFSADGQLVLDGELVLDLLVQPVTLKGDLQANGIEGREGPVPVKVDVTIDISTDPRDLRRYRHHRRGRVRPRRAVGRGIGKLPGGGPAPPSRRRRRRGWR